MNSTKLETNLNWLAPGYTAPLEPRIMNLDTRLLDVVTDEKKRKNLSVGSLISYLAPEDLDRIAQGQEVGSQWKSQTKCRSFSFYQCCESRIIYSGSV